MSDFKTLDDNAYATEHEANEEKHFSDDPYIKSLYEKNGNNYGYLSTINTIFCVLGVIGVFLFLIGLAVGGRNALGVMTMGIFVVLVFIGVIIFGFWFSSQLKKYSNLIKTHNIAPKDESFDKVISQRSLILLVMMIISILSAFYNTNTIF